MVEEKDVAQFNKTLFGCLIAYDLSLKKCNSFCMYNYILGLSKLKPSMWNSILQSNSMLLVK